MWTFYGSFASCGENSERVFFLDYCKPLGNGSCGITTSIILAIGVAIQLVILYSPEDAYRRNSRVKGKLNGLYKFKGESDEDFIYMHTYLKHFIIPKSTDKE